MRKNVCTYEHGRRLRASPIPAHQITAGQEWMTLTGKVATVLGVTHDGFATVRYQLADGRVCASSAFPFQSYYRLCVDGPNVPREYLY